MIGLRYCGHEGMLCDECEGVIRDGETMVKAVMMVAGREKPVQATMENFHKACYERLVDGVELRR